MHDLIRSLGGLTVVASALGVKPNAVSNWPKRGVPWRYRPAIAELAREKGVELPRGFLDVREAA